MSATSTVANVSEQEAQEVKTITGVAAENVKRLREERGWRQADLGELMAPAAGWTANTVAAVENGRRGISFEESVLLCREFRVPLTDLLSGKGKVVIGGELVLSRRLFRQLIPAAAAPVDPARRAVVESMADARDDIRKAAASLGVTPNRFHYLVQGNYGRLFHVERDSRAGDVSGLTERQARAKRGHATRAILAELREAIDQYGIDAVANGEARR